MMILLAMMIVPAWIVLISVYLYFVHTKSKNEARSSLPRAANLPLPITKNKPVPPFPFGPIADLIKEAEQRAQEEFYQSFPEERPEPDEPSSSAGYTMGSSPNGIIAFDARRMTLNEYRDLRRGYEDKAHGQAMVLPEVIELHPIQVTVVESHGMPQRRIYGRYLDGIGYVSADSEQKLERSCEAVLMKEFARAEERMRALDRMIIAWAGIPPASSGHMQLTKTKDMRAKEWEKCKLLLAQLQALNM